MEQSNNLSYGHTIEVARKWSRGFMISKQTTQDAALEKKMLSFADDPALSKAYIFYSLSLPASVKVSLANKEITSDMFIFVLSDNFFADKNINANTKQIPVALSKTLLTLYNTQIANATIFPELPEWILGFMDIVITFGKSEFFWFSGKTLDRKAKIQAVDPILPVGFVIPYSAAQDVLHTMDKWRLTPYKVMWFVRDGAAVDSIRSAYGKDFVVTTDAEKIKQVQDKLLGTHYFFEWITVAILIILVLFLIYITYSVVEHNMKIFQTLRLHGASDMHILRVLWMEICLYGWVSALCYGLGIVVIDIWILPVLSTMVQQQMHTAFVVQNLDIAHLVSIGLGYVLLFLLLGTVFSYREWSKKFENR